MLTRHLAASAAQVIAVEADPTLCERLNAKLSAAYNVTVRRGDFLKYRLPSGQYTFFSNIPFARTADIMRKLVFGSAPPQRAFVIMESIAATRFLGQPFGPESELSLRLKARFHPSIISWIPPQSFSPPPAANAVMLGLEARSEHFRQGSELRDFDRFARSIFRSHGGNARNILRQKVPGTAARSLTAELGFPAHAAPSNISFEHWMTVFRLARWNGKHA